MTTIIWKTAAPFGTSKSRYKARRLKAQAERVRSKQLARKVAQSLSGCNLRVLLVLPEE
ncbi:hypothetical protein [Pantoea sp. BAV 3049]|uniref:hypothetical protein n=1 Tax=Pantoea sp. BAV 3049 TaxID=2654188 RepID=UPI00131C43F6|nr:hypothetical protein [Pantoea sp. BAV 3049]